MSKERPNSEEEAAYWADEQAASDREAAAAAEEQALAADADREMGIDPTLEDVGCKD